MGKIISAQSVFDQILEVVPCTNTENREIYRIGELAREFNVSLRTLRFYEDRGLISPKRSGSTRLYSHDDRKRLKIILLAKNISFSLVDIQELLSLYDNNGDEKDTAYIIDKLKGQLKTLHIQKENISRSITDLDGVITRIEEIT